MERTEEETEEEKVLHGHLRAEDTYGASENKDGNKQDMPAFLYLSRLLHTHTPIESVLFFFFVFAIRSFRSIRFKN